MQHACESSTIKNCLKNKQLCVSIMLIYTMQLEICVLHLYMYSLC